MYNSEQIIDKIMETIISELITEKGLSHSTERTLACLKEASKLILRDICQNLKKLESFSINNKEDKFTIELKCKYLKEIYFPKGTYYENSYNDFCYKQKKLSRQFSLNNNIPLIEKLNLIPSNINLIQNIKYEYKEKSGSINYEKTVLLDTEIDNFIKNKKYLKDEKEEWNYETVKINSLELPIDDSITPIFTDDEIYELLCKENSDFNTEDFTEKGILDLICK